MKNKIKFIHFVGIGGSGMSGIAEIMHNMNYSVTGSDKSESTAVLHLKKRGITVFPQHKASNLNMVDVVVTSTAISKNNPELIEAKKRKIPIIPRAEMLSELMRFKEGIAIAGTHGKTTTTSILASIMNEAGLDPTYVVGGRINSIKNSARLGKSRLMLVEADESDASFLHLNPSNVLITNIDNDHMETYGDDEERLKQTFIDFIHQIPFYNSVFLCIEDKNVKTIIKHIARPIITYGFSKKADFYADEIKIEKNTSCFRVNSNQKNFKSTTIKIKLPGKHYVLNTIGAISIAHSLGVKNKDIRNALLNFEGVTRRFDFYENMKIDGKNFHLIDDYGHHPTEIKAVIKSIRNGFPRKKINLVFQPHRYSRTKKLFNEFIEILSEADHLFLFDIYSAGENQIQNISSKVMIKKISCDSTYIKDMDNAKEIILKSINHGEILLIMGAGSIGSWIKTNFLINQ